MKKILILASLLIIILMIVGCNNTAEPNKQILYVPSPPEEVAPPVVEEYAEQPEMPPYETLDNETPALNTLPAETRRLEMPRLHGGTLYETVSPENLTRFQYSSRYTFEQFFLPSIIFEMGDVVTHMLQTGDLRGMSELVFDVWENQVIMYVPVDEMIAMVEDIPGILEILMEAIEAGEDEMQLLEDLFHEITELGDGHIVDITFEELDEYTNAFIIEMKDVQAGWLSTFIGIAYNEMNGLFMFTLERAHDPAGAEAVHVFCALHITSRGSFFPIENTREAFATYIGYAMDGALGNPGHITERELWDIQAIRELWDIRAAFG